MYMTTAIYGRFSIWGGIPWARVVPGSAEVVPVTVSESAIGTSTIGGAVLAIGIPTAFATGSSLLSLYSNSVFRIWHIPDAAASTNVPPRMINETITLEGVTSRSGYGIVGSLFGIDTLDQTSTPEIGDRLALFAFLRSTYPGMTGLLMTGVVDASGNVVSSVSGRYDSIMRGGTFNDPWVTGNARLFQMDGMGGCSWSYTTPITGFEADGIAFVDFGFNDSITGNFQCDGLSSVVFDTLNQWSATGFGNASFTGNVVLTVASWVANGLGSLEWFAHASTPVDCLVPTGFSPTGGGGGIGLRNYVF